MLPSLLKYYSSLGYWDRAPLEKVKKMQLTRFRSMFEYARTHSKFYREHYEEHGVMNLRVSDFDDIQRVPQVSKDLFRKYPVADILTCPINEKLNLHTTSGSSGEPLRVYYDKLTDYTSHFRVIYALRKVAKYHPFKKITMVTRYEGDDQFEFEGDITLLNRVQKYLGVFQREIISIYEDTDKIIDRLLVSRPDVLWSTPSVLEMIVNRLSERGIALRIPFLYFTSENLSESQFIKFREHISDTIVDIYGSMESPCLGYEVNKSGKRWVYPNSNLFEIVNPRQFQDMQVGDVILTNLLNKVMPVIRYDLRDLTEVIDDPAVPHKYMGSIIGRIDDILEFEDGNQFVHHHAHEMFMDFEECDQFKFIQKSKGDIILQMKINSRHRKETVLEKAQQRWNKRFSMYPLKIEFVEKFEINAKTGKFKNIEKLG